MKKIVATIILSLSFCSEMMAQKDGPTTVPDSLTAVMPVKKNPINDYWTVGVDYGVTLSRMIFNPTVPSQEFLYSPNTFSLLFTKYCKMFGYMPYFGVEFGLSYSHQGFLFKKDPVTGKQGNYIVATEGNLDKLSYLTSEKISIVKIPARAKFHIDLEPVAIIVNLGCYAGWRTSIERQGPVVDEAIGKSFMSTDRRFDYGLEGGAGLSFYIDPVEIHLGALASWSWNSLFEPNTRPDSYSHYYYRYANPLNITIYAGVAFQLTKRRGKTNRELKKEAYEQVYGNHSGESRE